MKLMTTYNFNAHSHADSLMLDGPSVSVSKHPTCSGRPAITTGIGSVFVFFQAEDGIRDLTVTGVQTCALPIFEAGLLAAEQHGSTVSAMNVHVPDVRAALFAAYATDFGDGQAESGAARRAPTDAMIDAAERMRDARDRKSTRLNSSHSQISYAVFCLKKKRTTQVPPSPPALRVTTN